MVDSLAERRGFYAARPLLARNQTMFGPKPVTDKELLKTVNQKLARTGTASARVSADVRQGTVTLSGTLNYEIQRSALVKAASRTAGVRQVIDQMQFVPKKKC